MADNQHTTLGELFKNRREPGEADMPLMSVTMNDGLVDRESLERKTDSELTSEGHLLVRAGDIAYNMMRMWQGASGLAEHDAIVSPAYVVLAPTADIDPLFASYWFKSSRMIYLFWAYSYGITGDRLRLYYKDFARIPVMLPTKSRQTLIGKALSAWDREIEALNRLIAAKRRLKHGITQELLTGERRLPGFNEPWVKVKLSDIASVNPPTARPVSPDTEVTFLTMADIDERGGLLQQQVRAYEDVSNGFTKFQDGDIVIAKITPCYQNGKGALLSGLTNGLGFGTTELHVVRPHRECCASFLYYVTMSRPFRTRGIANMTGSAGQKRVPADFIRHYRFECPPLDEQLQIGKVLGNADREVSLLERKATLLIKQKRGLMQQLFDKGMKVKV